MEFFINGALIDREERFYLEFERELGIPASEMKHSLDGLFLLLLRIDEPTEITLENTDALAAVLGKDFKEALIEVFAAATEHNDHLTFSYEEDYLP